MYYRWDFLGILGAIASNLGSLSSLSSLHNVFCPLSDHLGQPDCFHLEVVILEFA